VGESILWVGDRQDLRDGGNLGGHGALCLSTATARPWTLSTVFLVEESAQNTVVLEVMAYKCAI